MSKKYGFYFLKEGDSVILQKVQWEGSAMKGVLKIEEGIVVRSLKRYVDIAVGKSQHSTPTETVEVVRFSRKGGQEFNSDEELNWRIAPSLARRRDREEVSYIKPEEHPGYQEVTRRWNVYPTHPLVSLVCMVDAFRCPEEAMFHNESGHTSAEASSKLPGAGGQASRALLGLRRFRMGRFSSLEEIMDWFDEDWTYLVGPGTGNHERSYQRGIDKARDLRNQPWLFPMLERWLWEPTLR